MRSYRVTVRFRDDEGRTRQEVRTIAAHNLQDAKAKANHRFGSKRVMNVSTVRREEQEEMYDDEFEDPGTNICPDCGGKKFVVTAHNRKVPCGRCDGAGEVFESSKPTFIQFLVEGANQMKIYQALRFLDDRWARKPYSWMHMAQPAHDEIFTEQDLARSRLSYSDIPTYHLSDFYAEQDYSKQSRHAKDGLPTPDTKFNLPDHPRETVFFVRVPRYGTFLVDTQGADHFRYMMKSALPRAKFG